MGKEFEGSPILKFLRKTFVSTDGAMFNISKIKSRYLFFASIVIAGIICVFGIRLFWWTSISVGDYEQGTAAFFSGLAFFYLVLAYETQKEELRLTRQQLELSKQELAGSRVAMEEQVKISSINSILQSAPILMRLEIEKIICYQFTDLTMSPDVVPSSESIASTVTRTAKKIQDMSHEVDMYISAHSNYTSTGSLGKDAVLKLCELDDHFKYISENRDQAIEWLTSRIIWFKTQVKSGENAIGSLRKIVEHRKQLEFAYQSLLEKSGSHQLNKT